jgi:transcriptional regulator with XRE-family HTH domain
MESPPEVAQEFGVNVLLARRSADLSQEKLSRRAQLHRTEIGKLEKGERLPRIDTVLKLAGALSVQPGDLLKASHGLPAFTADASWPVPIQPAVHDPESQAPAHLTQPGWAGARDPRPFARFHTRPAAGHPASMTPSRAGVEASREKSRPTAHGGAAGAMGNRSRFYAGNPSPDCGAGCEPCKPRLRRGSLRPSPSARVPGSSSGADLRV